MKEANVWVRYKKKYKSTKNSEHNKPLYKNELEQKSPQSSQIKRLSVILLIFGQYVPFNFCPRSVMLFVIHRGHDDFQGGQDRVLHLISNVDTIRLTNENCFFTDIHADLDYAEQIDDFNRITRNSNSKSLI